MHQISIGGVLCFFNKDVDLSLFKLHIIVTYISLTLADTKKTASLQLKLILTMSFLAFRTEQ